MERLTAFTRIEHHDECPWPDMEPGVLYLVEHVDGRPQFIWFLCPCGCENPVGLPVMPNETPHWDLTEQNGLLTLHPSCADGRNCRSHYWIRENRVDWV